ECYSYCLPLFRFFVLSDYDPRPLHSFPTRRSSDLQNASSSTTPVILSSYNPSLHRHGWHTRSVGRRLRCTSRRMARAVRRASSRSEEHTSELQSRENLVCRLLLEKKKKHPIDH